MEELIKKLDEIYSLSWDETNERFDDLYDDIANLAWELFTINSSPNYQAIREFNNDQAIYHVGPGETDSFGWLTGIISRKGRIEEIIWG